MIRIFNKKLKKEILIDDTVDFVTLTPKQYEIDNSHVLIELKGIHFLHHALTCEDCKAFVTDFGKNSFDWFIDINGLIKRLDLRFFGSEYTDNKATHIISYYFQGTKLKLNLDNSTIDEINNELLVLIEKEEFEQCCFLRDKLKALQDNIGS